MVFSDEQEDVLWRQWRKDDSVWLIARVLGCHTSREIHRNGGCDTYRVGVADATAQHRAQRPKVTRLATD